MTEVHTEIEPPDLPDDDGDDADEPHTIVHIGIIEVDGTRRAGYAGLPGEASDDDLADALIAALHGAAATRSPALADAIRRRTHDTEPGT